MFVKKMLRSLNFNNRTLMELPIDVSMNKKQREVVGACWSLVDPTPVLNPSLVSVSRDVLNNILEVNDLEKGDVELLSGNSAWPGARTAAHCYCGHQFGVFAGQLGDGATMYIGEILNSKGERWELQYKGAGLTPYSRTADGRKVLRSSVREFLCSEAMHALRIPTTRALSLINSDSLVVRDILYDGHPRKERCSIIIRVAPSFIRFGSFETARPIDYQSGAAGPNKNNPQIVRDLVKYVMKYFYPQCQTTEQFVLEVTRRTAKLIALWQAVGFAHGVMNTDNMSILGLTIDFGPFGFMERYDPHFICNRSDDQGRYAFSQQPNIGLWNCLKLVESFALGGELLSQPKTFVDEVHKVYQSTYEATYQAQMRSKLGLIAPKSKEEEEEQNNLVEQLFKTMHVSAADYTMTFKALEKCVANNDYNMDKYIRPCLGDVAAVRNVHKPRYEPRQVTMLLDLITSKGKANEVLEATGLTLSDVQEMAERIKLYTRATEWLEIDKQQNDLEVWSKFLSAYAKAPKVSDAARIMGKVNPRFVLRNHVAQRAIDLAERGQYDEVNKLLDLSLDPFNNDDSRYLASDGFKYDEPNPDPNVSCAVSCSS